MNPKIQEFLDRIQQLEAAIEQEAKSRRQQWQRAADSSFINRGLLYGDGLRRRQRQLQPQGQPRAYEVSPGKKVEKVNGQLWNQEFASIKDVKDPGKAK